MCVRALGPHSGRAGVGRNRCRLGTNPIAFCGRSRGTLAAGGGWNPTPHPRVGRACGLVRGWSRRRCRAHLPETATGVRTGNGYGRAYRKRLPANVSETDAGARVGNGYGVRYRKRLPARVSEMDAGARVANGSGVPTGNGYRRASQNRMPAHAGKTATGCVPETATAVRTVKAAAHVSETAGAAPIGSGCRRAYRKRLP
jgi:hypothetical protein